MCENKFKPGQKVRNKYLTGGYEARVVGLDPFDSDFVVVVFAGSHSYEGWRADSVIAMED